LGFLSFWPHSSADWGFFYAQKIRSQKENNEAMEPTQKAERRRQEETYMDWQIASAKAIACKKRYDACKTLGNLSEAQYWLDLIESHIEVSNRYLAEITSPDRDISDLVLYLGAERRPDPQLVEIPFGRPIARLGEFRMVPAQRRIA